METKKHFEEVCVIVRRAARGQIQENVQLAARPARPEKLGWLVSLITLGKSKYEYTNSIINLRKYHQACPESCAWRDSRVHPRDTNSGKVRV